MGKNRAYATRVVEQPDLEGKIQVISSTLGIQFRGSGSSYYRYEPPRKNTQLIISLRESQITVTLHGLPLTPKVTTTAPEDIDIDDLVDIVRRRLEMVKMQSG